jgi:hypothetical protein
MDEIDEGGYYFESIQDVIKLYDDFIVYVVNKWFIGKYTYTRNDVIAMATHDKWLKWLSENHSEWNYDGLHKKSRCFMQCIESFIGTAKFMEFIYDDSDQALCESCFDAFKETYGASDL